jgi:hypothetical protein
MDKAYMIDSIEERSNILHRRYRNAVSGKDDNGTPITRRKAYQNTTTIKREMVVCRLLGELVDLVEGDSIDLSDDATTGFLRVVEPMERHRRKAL